MKKICKAINARGKRCKFFAAKDYGYCARHLKKYYASLPKKRMAVGALIFNARRELLILKPTYKDMWTLPGGVIDQNESPRDALLREVREELGIELKDAVFLSIDYMSREQSQYITKDENMQFIFYGGILNTAQIARFRLPKQELSDYMFVSIKKATTLLTGNLARRLPASLNALKHRTAYYLEAGRKV